MRCTAGAAAAPRVCIALGTTAVGIAAFFIAFATLFSNRTARVFAYAAAACGAITGICFAGVAATPWNLYLAAHNVFVTWAFRAFLAAVLASLVAGLNEPGFPRRFAVVFGTFAVLLAAYVGLPAFGPRPSTPAGARVQVTGQKAIAYASVITVMLQAAAVVRLVRAGASPPHWPVAWVARGSRRLERAMFCPRRALSGHE